LLGRISDVSAARVRFSEGALAGTELHLRTQGAGLVTAELLTVGGQSRQTLAAVMEEMRLRLKMRGIVLSVMARSVPGNGTAETTSSATSRYGPPRHPR
jgi:hypothetical protein